MNLKISQKEQNAMHEKQKKDGEQAFLDGKSISSNPFSFLYDSFAFRAWNAGYMFQHNKWLDDQFNI